MVGKTASHPVCQRQSPVEAPEWVKLKETPRGRQVERKRSEKVLHQCSLDKGQRHCCSGYYESEQLLNFCCTQLVCVVQLHIINTGNVSEDLLSPALRSLICFEVSQISHPPKREASDHPSQRLG